MSGDERLNRERDIARAEAEMLRNDLRDTMLDRDFGNYYNPRLSAAENVRNLVSAYEGAIEIVRTLQNRVTTLREGIAAYRVAAHRATHSRHLGDWPDCPACEWEKAERGRGERGRGRREDGADGA